MLLTHWAAALGRLHTIPPQPTLTGVHAPFLHASPCLQTVPQPPQFLTSLVRLASQPLAGVGSQSASPPVQHAMMHTVLASVARLTSQPLAAVWSQSAKPALHDLMAQALLTQSLVAFWSLQKTPPQPLLLLGWVQTPLSHCLLLQSPSARHFCPSAQARQ